MDTTEKLNKVKSIIESCLTYDQLQSCMSFVQTSNFFPENLDRIRVMGFIQHKAYSMRLADLKDDIEKLKQIQLK